MDLFGNFIKKTTVDISGKEILDTLEDVIVISNKSRISRLIVILALVLIAIVVNTIEHFDNSTPRNSCPGITTTIPFVNKPSMMDNDVAGLLANILNNPFVNHDQNASFIDPVTPNTDFSSPFLAAFFVLGLEYSNYHKNLTYIW